MRSVIHWAVDRARASVANLVIWDKLVSHLWSSGTIYVAGLSSVSCCLRILISLFVARGTTETVGNYHSRDLAHTHLTSTGHAYHCQTTYYGPGLAQRSAWLSCRLCTDISTPKGMATSRWDAPLISEGVARFLAVVLDTRNCSFVCRELSSKESWKS